MLFFSMKTTSKLSSSTFKGVSTFKACVLQLLALAVLEIHLFPYGKG